MQVFHYSSLQVHLLPRVQKLLKKMNTYPKKIFRRSRPNSHVRKTALFETHAIYLEGNRLLQSLRETSDDIQVFLLSSLMLEPQQPCAANSKKRKSTQKFFVFIWHDARALAPVCGKQLFLRYKIDIQNGRGFLEPIEEGLIICKFIHPPKSFEARALVAVCSKQGKRTYTPLKILILMPQESCAGNIFETHARISDRNRMLGAQR